ncbi:MAG: two-component sensor histidine kinase [Desulfovibrionaceae bacterium]|nr:two-component sensor histidine kinase [Desulfovibrionaceae bacterium]
MSGSFGRHLRHILHPPFWTFDPQSSPYTPLFNFKRIWVHFTLLLALAALVPLVVVLTVDYGISRSATLAEHKQRTVRAASNARRTITYFMEERLSALRFIVEEETAASLSRPDYLSRVMRDLKYGFGGIMDLGIIDVATGEQTAYAGPYNLLHKNYSDQQWFVRTVADGEFVSDVFLGFRGVAHAVIAVKSTGKRGKPFILRATLDTTRLVASLDNLREQTTGSEAILVNHEGVLQTPSALFGKVLEKVPFPVPPPAQHTEYRTLTDNAGRSFLAAYAYIENSPNILVVMTPRDKAMAAWSAHRTKFLWFSVISLGVVVVIILGSATFIVNKIYEADQNRMETLRRMERTNRLAAIGRLAAGVAHEINNPLAIINEKAGLISDYFELEKRYARDERLLKPVNTILDSVERAGKITKQLLGFARNTDMEMRPVRVAELVEEILSFFTKESAYRDITICVDMAEDLPEIVTDRSKVLQIIINLVTNAFQAMADGAHLTIRAGRRDDRRIFIDVADTGCGIDEKNLKDIFDPFFSTRKRQGGTGLGLYITYGLARDLGGDISVASTKGQGTTFTVVLPIGTEATDDETALG